MKQIVVHQYSLTDWFKQVLPRGKKELPISKVNIGCNQTISFVTLTLTFIFKGTGADGEYYVTVTEQAVSAHLYSTSAGG